MKTKIISISAISASFIALFLVLGAYVSFLDLVSVIFASVFVMLPLYYKSYLGSILAYIAGAVLAFLISGFNIISLVFPAFLVFFGIYPIVKCKAMEKGINSALYTILTLIWCVAFCYGIYFFYTYVALNPFENLPKWVSDYLYIIIGVLGIVIYFLYDRCVIIVKRLLDFYLNKIIKK